MVLGVGSWYKTIIVIGVSDSKRPNLVGTKLERTWSLHTCETNLYIHIGFIHEMVQYGIYHVP